MANRYGAKMKSLKFTPINWTLLALYFESLHISNKIQQVMIKQATIQLFQGIVLIHRSKHEKKVEKPHLDARFFQQAQTSKPVMEFHNKLWFDKNNNMC